MYTYFMAVDLIKVPKPCGKFYDDLHSVGHDHFVNDRPNTTQAAGEAAGLVLDDHGQRQFDFRGAHAACNPAAK
jgi:hypothetical protein